jgi:hypothetical protein
MTNQKISAKRKGPCQFDLSCSNLMITGIVKPNMDEEGEPFQRTVFKWELVL